MITQPNIHSELYKATFIDDFIDYESADECCQSLNNFRQKDIFIQFKIRCLDQEEFDVVRNFIKTNHNRDVSEVYSPFIQAITL